MPDRFKNFAISTVQASSGVIASGTGTTVILATGDGAKFPVVPYNIVVWPASAQPTTATAEIMRVTSIATDTLTVVRGQESTTALTNIASGFQVMQAVTQRAIDEIAFAAQLKYRAIGA